MLTPKRLSLVCALFFCLMFAGIAFAGDDWREVTPAELQMKTPKVEPDADAEVIFWEVRVDDSNPESMVMKHYIRVKIFTDRGREKYSKIDIPFTKGIRIKGIMARVIKADGSIVELEKTDVFDREIAKADKIKVKAKSFAVPNLEPGVMVEYRYQEVYDYGSAEDMRMVFQHDVPIENISYYFKPYNNVTYLRFNMSDNKFVKDKSGFYKATMENVPALKKEPEMPPEDEVRSWLLVYYTEDTRPATTNNFWSRAGYYIAKKYEIKDTLKPGKEVKAASAEITAASTEPDEQLHKLFDFCKNKVKNITFDTELTDEQKEEIKPNKSTADTYKKLQGTTTDINELFASLATAAGFEARLAFGGDRSEKFFDPSQAHESFVHFSSVAVKVNGTWKYYDPGSKFVPYGMLAWNEESTAVLLLGYKDYITTETPYSNSDKSDAKRTGRFTLDEDGNLDGTVSIEYTGQFSFEKKMDNYKDSANKREETLKDEIKESTGAAPDISNISIENVADPEKPFVCKYKIHIPNYAQKTGKRLFVQPGFFEYGKSPLFSTATRSYSIFFHHPWSEQDDVEIALPAGYTLDNADMPAPINDPSRIGVLNITMSVSDKNVLKYKRSFSFGNNNYTLFPAGSYAAVKNLFDAFYKADTHSIALKQK